MVKNAKKILMLAAENGALPGGKVGGMGDVVRDIPPALGKLGHQVDVLLPGYQHFSKLPGAKKISEVSIEFRGETVVLALFKLSKKRASPGVQIWVLDHAMLAPNAPGEIYCNDTPDRPFATDASKFALFSIAAAQAIKDRHFGELDAIHLHDWHTAFVAVLARFHQDYAVLNSTPLIYTIHNLSLQGVRPFSWDDSALENWYRGMTFDYQKIRDPQHDNCFNPMRAAINLCDKVHAVSPNYCLEIQRPSDSDKGFVGGEGLEEDLQNCAQEHRLVGILNACEYPTKVSPLKDRPAYISAIKRVVNKWRKSKPGDIAHELAFSSIERWQKRQKLSGEDASGSLLTSVGRISDQKIRILLTQLTTERLALEQILKDLGPLDVFVLLGSGDSVAENQLLEIAKTNQNFIFLRGYSDRLAQILYDAGDLFMMPSSFEPCGISQMLAMRSGQPCLVHEVGGLVDTVHDNQDGFGFSGDSPIEQAQNMVERLREVLILQAQQPKQWLRVKNKARAARFLWSDVAKSYLAKLY